MVIIHLSCIVMVSKAVVMQLYATDNLFCGGLYSCAHSNLFSIDTIFATAQDSLTVTQISNAIGDI